MERSSRVGPGPTCTSLPIGHHITSEQSYTEAEMKPASLPPLLHGNKGFIPHQHDVYLHGIITPQSPELDTDNESDPDTVVSSDLLPYLPLKSLRPHPNGDPLVISGDMLNTSGSETDSRPQLEIESNMQVPEPEEIVKTVADTHLEANVSSFIECMVVWIIFVYSLGKILCTMCMSFTKLRSGGGSGRLP